MLDYAHQTVDLYKSITNTKSLKHAATPFVPDGSVSVEDEEAKGELASIYLSIYLFICPSIYLSIYRSIYLSIDRSIYLPIYLSIYLYVYIYIYLYINRSG